MSGRAIELRFPNSLALVQGDAHPGNLIRAPYGRVVLGDWDHVATGPPEWDLVQIHYTSRRLGYPRGKTSGALPGYSTAAACALSSGLSRSVAAAASADTIRSVPPPRPYLVS
jgi:aminoglycoside phosphotransferase (APT) family kinase protein